MTQPSQIYLATEAHFKNSLVSLKIGDCPEPTLGEMPPSPSPPYVRRASAQTVGARVPNEDGAMGKQGWGNRETRTGQRGNEDGATGQEAAGGSYRPCSKPRLPTPMTPTDAEAVDNIARPALQNVSMKTPGLTATHWPTSRRVEGLSLPIYREPLNSSSGVGGWGVWALIYGAPTMHQAWSHTLHPWSPPVLPIEL